MGCPVHVKLIMTRSIPLKRKRVRHIVNCAEIELSSLLGFVESRGQFTSAKSSGLILFEELSTQATIFMNSIGKSEDCEATE
jgi:hypothetical protein